jgi:choline kinase
MKAVILAAGIGSRLKNPYPKTLTMLRNGCSILQLQVRNLTRYIDIHDIIVVVGFKKELIMEAFPDLIFIYNDYFDTTNTAKSLLKGFQKVKNEDILWLNGDVVFDHRIIDRLLKSEFSCMAVNTSEVNDEEVKYSVNSDGSIKEVSKKVQNPLGEALGINIVKSTDLELLKNCLKICNNNDYFEHGIELAIQQGLKIFPLDVSDLACIEIDFLEDLKKANDMIKDKINIM